MLKHRLTGAAVLIGFAVVLLPMLLGGPEEEPDTEPAGQAGREPDSNVFRSNITPIGGDTPSVQAMSEPDDKTEDGAGASAGATIGEDGDGAARDNDPGSGQASATAGADEDAPESPQAADSGDEPEADSNTDAATEVERGWIVQVGTFKNADNVTKLVAQLENDGFSASTSEVDTSEGVATRVWVGPYETRVEAARNKTQVKQRTGTEGLIVAYP